MKAGLFAVIFKIMSHQEIREKFLKYFESKGHKIVPSSSLLPNDPSVLFTTAGMQQFKPYYTGASDAMKDFGSLNTVSIQKCIRTSDIDEVGDESHHTFFEMLGNFSFGGYWKKEAIFYAHEFITKEIGLQIDYVTVFEGNTSVPRDSESAEIWKSLDSNLKVTDGSIHDNFWGPTGNEGPCGPTTEIYVNGVEVWNIVFNEFYYLGSREELLSGKNDKELKPLETKGIDTGMGLERLAMVTQNKKNNYETDLFKPLMSVLPESLSEKNKRIVCDHARASVFMIADEMRPSNKEQGYVLRRLLRRALVHLASLKDFNSKDIFTKVIDEYKSIYGDLNVSLIIPVIQDEETKFSRTLKQGLKELASVEIITNASAFKLFESFGLPYEIIKEMAGSKAEALTRQGFEEEFKKHQEISRAGAEKKFGGHGITIKEGDLTAENQEEMVKKTRLHTATHLMLAGLRKVLGNQVHQEGADITTERLRFDFNHPVKVTPEEIKQIEDWVNDVISKDVTVTKEEMAYKDAIESGAMGAFKDKYPERVFVYSIGEYSKEICGGPHVEHTGLIGKFKITKEESASAGKRRLRAVIS